VKLPNDVVKTAANTGAEESRGPTVVPAPTAVDPELSTRPQRRRFTTQEKLRILAAARCRDPIGFRRCRRQVRVLLARPPRQAPTLSSKTAGQRPHPSTISGRT
jgi:hypothetical protein